MEVVAEEITIIEVSGETSMEIVLKETVSGVVDLIIDIIYYYYFLNKRSAIYIGNLDISQQSMPLISENKYIINLINIPNTLWLCITKTS